MKFVLLIFSIVTVSLQVYAEGPVRHEFRGVWFSQNNAIKFTPDSLDRLFKQFADAGFNAVFPRVWYRGGTIYPSDVVETAGGPRQLSAFRQSDPMPVIIETAHRHGLEVHAWMEYGFMMSAGSMGPILTANPDWKIISIDSLSYEETIYGRFYWADPANPDVRHFLVDLHREVAEKYPDLDGIHTDRLRFPNDEFSYSAAARQRYQDETGGPDPITIERGTAEWNNWVQWRRLQTTLAQKEINEAVKSVREDITVSAAVVPPYMIGSGAGQEKLQYWPDWTANGYLDILMPMLYLPDASFTNQFASARSLAGDFDEVYPGITYQHSMAAGGDVDGANESLAYQINHTRSVDVEGYVIWYQGYLIQYDVLSFLKEDVQNDIPVIPQRDRIVSPETENLFERTGTWNEETGGPWNTYYTAQNNANTTAAWEFSFPYSNLYEMFIRVDGDDSYASSAHYNVYVNGVDEKSITLSHAQSGAGWRYLDDISLSANDDLVIELDAGSSDGTVYASAARVRVRQQPRIESVDVLNAGTIKLNFNFNVLENTVPLPADVQFDPPVTVTAVESDDESASSIRINTETGLSYYTLYTVTIESITDASGRIITDLRRNFSYYPDGTTEWVKILNDGDADVFRLDGNMDFWSNKISAVSGYVGNGYRQTFTKGGSVGLQRAFWSVEVPAGGMYTVWANWTSDVDRSIGVPYVIHRDKLSIDTVRVDQRYAGSSWHELGVYEFDAGDSLTIELNNDVQPPAESTLRVIADAVRVQRMYTTSADGRIDEHKQLPEKITLYQNYPNPFNPVTSIRFSLPESGQVLLRVYDMLGRLVHTVVDDRLEAGTHTVRFDGSRISSGLYFYRLTGNGHTLTRRMILIK